MRAAEPLLQAEGVTVGRPGRPEVLRSVDVTVPAGSFTAVVGPNGCGKSTLLLTLARILRPTAGRVLVQGRDLAQFRPRDLARTLALLPQQPEAPDGILVRDLVLRGRQPHRGALTPVRAADRAAVEDALRTTGTLDLADGQLARLSGGQRQRVWIAMALAQQTPAVLLDEPTSFLDVAHQVDVLDTCSALVRGGRTVVAVLHDLSLAARYADHVVVLRDGAVVAAGFPDDVVTERLVAEVFDLPARVLVDPETGRPLVVPRDRRPPALAPPPVPTVEDQPCPHP
ncbi:ABC transporter ATP-binding protein [Kineococcus endophyticus]|uniref:ABC transporter ATP-binding protein n=1 Tax=Kineococcus endophyticus TaxID=1181883 RepID=A0ABV3PCA7_9ACTN